MANNIPEGRFPFGKTERRQQANFGRDSASLLRKLEKIQPTSWDIYDSPLLETPGRPGPSFDYTFHNAIPIGAGTLKQYIEKSLEQKKGNAIAIEFGGPGSALFAGFSKGFFARSLGVTLADIRKRSDPDPTKEDNERHHSVMQGNLMSKSVYDRTRKWLAGKKADLIIERMEGGLQHIPEDPFLIGELFETWYGMLAENGVILAQTSFWMRPILRKWKEKLQAECKDSLDFEYKYDPESGDARDALRLRKLPGAPKKLPMLDAREIREISKAMVTRIE